MAKKDGLSGIVEGGRGLLFRLLGRDLQLIRKWFMTDNETLKWDNVSVQDAILELIKPQLLERAEELEEMEKNDHDC